MPRGTGEHAVEHRAVLTGGEFRTTLGAGRAVEFVVGPM
jgi:hypothetical protein